MTGRALIVGASRGIGLGLASAYAEAGWEVMATKRDGSRTQGLDALGSKITVMNVDIRFEAEIAALAAAIEVPIDLLLVNAGVGGEIDRPPALEDIIVTNAVGPIRVLDALIDRVVPGGVAAVMTSILGSVAGNNSGGLDSYRASKAALNSLTRSFAARQPRKDYALLSLHPGWVRTDMGGGNAAIDVATSVAGLVRVIAEAEPGTHRYLDYLGREIPW